MTMLEGGKVIQDFKYLKQNHNFYIKGSGLLFFLLFVSCLFISGRKTTIYKMVTLFLSNPIHLIVQTSTTVTVKQEYI